jgi:hypothetical protein
MHQQFQEGNAPTVSRGKCTNSFKREMHQQFQEGNAPTVSKGKSRDRHKWNHRATADLGESRHWGPNLDSSWGSNKWTGFRVWGLGFGVWGLGFRGPNLDSSQGSNKWTALLDSITTMSLTRTSMLAMLSDFNIPVEVARQSKPSGSHASRRYHHCTLLLDWAVVEGHMLSTPKSNRRHDKRQGGAGWGCRGAWADQVVQKEMLGKQVSQLAVPRH